MFAKCSHLENVSIIAPTCVSRNILHDGNFPSQLQSDLLFASFNRRNSDAQVICSGFDSEHRLPRTDQTVRTDKLNFGYEDFSFSTAQKIPSGL